MINAVIFDFDGLILETELPVLQAWQEIYREYKCEVPLDKWVACIGGSEEDFDVLAYLETRVGYPIERIAMQARSRKRQMEMIASQEILPGVEDYLHEAKRLGLKIGLASNSSHEWVEGHLQRLGVYEHFDCIKCGPDVVNRKPDPELYLAALAALDVRAEEAIAFEDSPNGVRAARSAGIFSVAVPGVLTRQLSLDHADLRLDSMAAQPLTDVIASAERALQKRRSSLV